MITKTVKEWREEQAALTTISKDRLSKSDPIPYDWRDRFIGGAAKDRAQFIETAIDGLPDHQEVTL